MDRSRIVSDYWHCAPKYLAGDRHIAAFGHPAARSCRDYADVERALPTR